MPIATFCPKCKAKLKGPDALIGHTLNCPGCGTPVTITAAALVPGTAPGQVTAKPQAPTSGTPAPQAPKLPPPMQPKKAPPQPPTPPKKEPDKKTTKPSKSSIYDDLEIIDEDTAETPPAKTQEAPRLPPPQSAKPAKPPVPSPKPAKPPVPSPKPQQRPAESAKPPKSPTEPAVFPNMDLDKADVPVKDAKEEPPLFANMDLDKVADLPAKETKPDKPLLPNMDLDKAPHVPVKDTKAHKPLFPNMDLDKVDVPLLNEDEEPRLQDFDDVKLQGDDDVKLQGDDIPLTEADQGEEEAFDDFEVIEDGHEEEAVEVEEADDDEPMEVEAADDDEPMEVEAADDDEADDLEVVNRDGAGSEFSFKLLKPSVLFVRGQSGMFTVNNAYDLLNGKTQKTLGKALEKKDDSAQVLALFVGNKLVPTRIEVLEGRDQELVLTVKRPPSMWNSKAEIFDNDDELVGSFEIHPFSALMSQPVWIRDHRDKKVAKMKALWMQGKCLYSTPDDKKLCETMIQAVYEQRIVVRWAPRGGSFYITFTKLADQKPRQKLLLLGVALGVDLFFNQRQGPSIGGRRF